MGSFSKLEKIILNLGGIAPNLSISVSRSTHLIMFSEPAAATARRVSVNDTKAIIAFVSFTDFVHKSDLWTYNTARSGVSLGTYCRYKSEIAFLCVYL